MFPTRRFPGKPGLGIGHQESGKEDQGLGIDYHKRTAFFIFI